MLFGPPARSGDELVVTPLAPRVLFADCRPSLIDWPPPAPFCAVACTYPSCLGPFGSRCHDFALRPQTVRLSEPQNKAEATGYYDVLMPCLSRPKLARWPKAARRGRIAGGRCRAPSGAGSARRSIAGAERRSTGTRSPAVSAAASSLSALAASRSMSGAAVAAVSEERHAYAVQAWTRVADS